jgi:signal transduction histidine kinase
MSIKILQVEQKGIDLILDYKTDQRQINADEGRVKQVLLGLISNAIKFTEVGYVKIIAFIE